MFRLWIFGDSYNANMPEKRFERVISEQKQTLLRKMSILAEQLLSISQFNSNNLIQI